MKKYSIWLKIKDADLQDQIDRMSGQWHVDRFDAHITLLGGINGERTEVIRAFQAWDAPSKAININLGDLTFSNSFYQCIFYPIKASLALFKLRQSAEQYFKRHQAYFPHVSVLYSDINLEERMQMVQNTSPIKKNISCYKICLIDTSDSIKDWTIISTK